MNDINNYIGVPWVQGGSSREGADCWGLVLLVSREVFGLDLGLYEGATYTGEELSQIIEDECADRHWELVEQPQQGDVATLTAWGSPRPSHVGIMLDGSRVLHSLESASNGASCVHPLPVLRRLFGKIEIYRYADNNNAS